MSFAVNSTFDVAFWFADQALNENEYLQPHKMHRLLYMAQAYYAIANEGKKLMPAVFVADDLGPIEPTLYQAFSRGRPDVDVELFLPTDIELFLSSIWRRFGHLSADRLGKLITESTSYSVALRKGKRMELSTETMISAFKESNKDPSLAKNLGSRVLVTQDGAPVKVKAWVPGAKS